MSTEEATVNRHGGTGQARSGALKNLIPAAYVANAALVLIVGGLLYESTQEVMRSSRAVDHTLEVLGQISAVEGEVAKAQSAQRGFLLFREPAFLHDRDDMLAEAGRSLTRLATLIAENRRQRERLAQLRDIIDARSARMREDAHTAMSSGYAFEAVARMNRGTTPLVYAIAGQMKDEELGLLEQRRESLRAHVLWMREALAGSVFIFLLLIVPSYAAFAQESRRRMRAERSMEQLAESFPGAVFRFRRMPGGKRVFELLTSRAESLRGIDRAAALRDASAVERNIVEQDRAHMTGAFAQAERTMSPLTVDYRVRVGEAIRWIRASAAPAREKDGTILWTGYWDDVTNHRNLEEELLRARDVADAANRAKSVFLATMSHEIRTPMNGVLGMLELLSLSPLDKDQRTTLNLVQDSGMALLRIIDDILDFSKIEAGKLEIRPEPASVARLLERLRNVYSGSATSKGLLLRCQVDHRIRAWNLVDEVRLAQILGNLVSNAIKFTDRGEVDLRAQLLEQDEARDVVSFTVRDSGIGIPAEDQSRLFSPFTQAGAASRNAGGTGLGLSISRRLAELMGGQLTMRSVKGEGTTMTLVLPIPVSAVAPVPPLAAPDERSASPSRVPPPVSVAIANGTYLLVVDDHPINRMVLRGQVQALGYAAQTAENGRDALDKWRAGHFGAIITDCNMPDMDGYALAQRIRASEREAGSRRTPIIACTANVLGGEAEKCLAAGMDDYLAKPVQVAQLARKLERWLPLDPEALAAPSPEDAGVDERVLAQRSGAAVEA